jgi:hypothetical protein
MMADDTSSGAERASPAAAAPPRRGEHRNAPPAAYTGPGPLFPAAAEARGERVAALRRELAILYAESAWLRVVLEESRNPVWLRWRWIALALRGLGWLFAGPPAYFAHRINRRRIERSGVFDAAWYLERYPDVAAGPRDPLEHYARFGAREGRQPNPYFEPEWYWLQCPVAAALRLNPLVHYLRKGAARGLSPHPEAGSATRPDRHPAVRAYPTLLHYLMARGLPGTEGARGAEALWPVAAPASGAGAAAFTGAGAGRRVCAFSHFDREGCILGYVRHYLDALTRAGFEIHFISTSPELEPSGRAALEAKGIRTHVRENRGRDFGSWQWALRHIPSLAESDTLLLANDSVFGPLYDPAELFAAMRADPADLWGITDSPEVQWHLQSYFLCLSRRARESRAFRDIFAQDFAAYEGKRKIVLRGEIALTQALIAEGFAARAYCPHDRIAPLPSHGRRFNPTIFAWDSLIVEQRCPFLKRELFLGKPVGSGKIARWRAVVEGFTDYDSTLIDEYLRHAAPPADQPGGR